MRLVLCLVIAASLLVALGCSGRPSGAEKKKDDASHMERLPKEKAKDKKGTIGLP
jgi:hypothetical protein